MFQATLDQVMIKDGESKRSDKKQEHEGRDIGDEAGSSSVINRKINAIGCPHRKNWSVGSRKPGLR
jgi:hypothetical protein